MVSRYSLILLAGLALGFSVVASPDLATAQSTNDLINRITRLEAEIRDLQRLLFAGGANPAPVVSSTPVQGTSLTPVQGGSDNSSGTAARTEIRLQQLEARMRNLNGKIEELDFKVTQSVRRADTLVSDLDGRFAVLEKEKPADASSIGASSQGTPSLAAGTETGQGAVAGASPPQGKIGGILGYLNQTESQKLEVKRREDPATPTTPAPQTAAIAATAPILPQGDSVTRYKHAFSYLMRHDYDTAEAAFREFIAGDGEGPLAGNAMYWLGETYYVREKFAEAAVTFAEGYEKHPGSPKTADNLLKLGFSLARLQRSEDACVALAQLSDEFPNASTTIKRRAMTEGKRIGCKG
jgi:tol-pal system protein YbgF